MSATTQGELSHGLAGKPLSLTPLNRKDFTSDAEVRWCPGCGDYAILAALQGVMPTLGVAPENTVVVSGIGCSSRLPYYIESFGVHSIHGRAPAIASGVAIARPDLQVWVATGDGDGLSIGGNHLIHALRRNVNLTIVLFNNRIYGLTKGQYSPTSEFGKVTKSTPYGSVDAAFNPICVALGAEASFVARTVASNRAHMTEVFEAAARHRGASFVEVYQNCPIFNDGAFEDFGGVDTGSIPLRHGQPIVFGPGDAQGVWRDPATGELSIVDVATVGLDAILIHDAHRADPSLAFALARLTDPGVMHHAPIGIFRAVERPEYGDLVHAQLTVPDDRAASLQQLMFGQDTWTVS